MVEPDEESSEQEEGEHREVRRRCRVGAGGRDSPGRSKEDRSFLPARRVCRPLAPPAVRLTR